MEIVTQNLKLIPCSIDIADSIINNKKIAENLIDAQIPQGWPQEDLKDFLPFYIGLLKDDPETFGWGIWLIIHQEDKTVIGDIGFKGKPDKDGIIEIGYSILPSHRRRGYATEAAKAIVEWGFKDKSVKKIIAECDMNNEPSIKVLETLRMKQIKEEKGLLHWELEKKA